MSELPEGWAEAAVLELAGRNGVVTDGDWVESKDQDPNGTVRLVQLADIGDGYFIDKSQRFMNMETVERLNCTLLKEGDVLVARMPDPLGRACIFPKIQQEAVTAVDVFVWRPDPEIAGAEARWLMHAVNSPAVRQQLQSQAGGTTRQRVAGGRIKELRLPVPPLSEQNRIVAKVDGLTARTFRARKELDRVPALIARYKQRILALAAEGMLTTKWRAENKASKWVPTSVAEIAQNAFDGPFGSNLKSADYVESGVRVVRLENIGNLRFIREKETYVSKAKFKTLARHELRPDDVLFSSFIAEEIRVCLLPDDLDSIAINKADCFCVRVNQQLCLPKFLAFRLASPTSYKALKEAVHGATRPRISLTHLKQFEIELPSLAEQAEIIRVLESAFGWLDRMAADHFAASKLLLKLGAAILAKAFRGELVPQDPNDEPASVVLDRIKAEAKTALKGRRTRSEGVVSETRIKVRDEVIRPRQASKGQKVTKSRQDDDVFGKPYLAAIIKKGRRKSAQELFKSADLSVSDFYKQLAWEINQNHIRDHGEWLEAA